VWIFTTIGFFDLVANREKVGWIIVKARCEADIWNLYKGYRDRFPMQKPVSNPAWDYRWGIHMKQQHASRLVAQLVSEINYSLFKGAVHQNPTQQKKARTYLDIWARMRRVQDEEEGL
jgi:hypothetical protein